MALAEEKYDIHDPEILHAIKVHTTGEPDMNMLDKIVYIADYIEPLRKEAPHLAEIRQNSSFTWYAGIEKATEKKRAFSCVQNQ